MNDSQENFMSMDVKTIDYLNLKESLAIRTGNKALDASLGKREAVVKKIHIASKKQMYDNSTFIEEKKETKALTIVQAVIVCGILRSYASAIEDKDLYKNVDYNKSKLNKTRDTLFIQLISFLVEKSTKLIDELKDYGMTQDIIDALKKVAKDYDDAIAKPEIAKAQVKEATIELKGLFVELREIYDTDLDNNMQLYMTSHPGFYNGYLLNRNIYQTGHFAKSLYGKVTDEETKETMAGIAVTIVRFKAGADLANTVKKTTDKGNYQWKKIVPGTYDVTFSKTNYDTITKRVEIIKNKGLRLDIALRKTE